MADRFKIKALTHKLRVYFLATYSVRLDFILRKFKLSRNCVLQPCDIKMKLGKYKQRK
jgi:hypothetical protein